MKHIKRYILINYIISILLSALSYFLLYNYDKDNEEMSINRSLSLHQQQIESFIDDAVSTVETVTTVIDVTSDKEAILTSIRHIKERDARYKNINIIDQHGKIILSSNNRLVGTAEHPFAFYKQHLNPHKYSINFNTEELNGVDDIYVSKIMRYKGKEVAVVAEMNIDTLMTAIDAIQSSRTVELSDLNNNILYKTDNPEKITLSSTSVLQNVDWKLKIISTRNLALETLEKTGILFVMITLTVGTIQLFRDIYERQKEKIRLIDEVNAQKKELIGMLAANTAHEIKNPLTSVRGFVELLELKYDRERQNPHFGIIKSEIDRITDIVGQFLLLGKPTEISDAPTDVVAVVKNTLNFMKYDFEMHQIRIISSYEKPVLYTMMSSDQLKQVLINLLQNAKEAIPAERRGIIDIKVQLQDDIVIAISDNGTGMPESSLRRLYEPFFTTKITGTGLGLPVTRNMIELAGGTIKATSTVDVGTTFIITLPVSQS